MHERVASPSPPCTAAAAAIHAGTRCRVPITLRAGKAVTGASKVVLMMSTSAPFLPDGFTGVNPAQQMRIAFSPPVRTTWKDRVPLDEDRAGSIERAGGRS